VPITMATVGQKPRRRAGPSGTAPAMGEGDGSDAITGVS